MSAAYNGVILGLLLLSTALAGSAQMKDFQGYKDPELFTRMPNFYLAYGTSFQEKQYAAHEF